MRNPLNHVGVTLSGLLIPIGILAIAASPALGGTLDQAELRIRMRPAGSPSLPNPEISFPGSGASGWSIDPSFASLLPGNAFAGSAPLTAITPATVGLTIAGNALGQFTGSPLVGPAAFDANLCVGTPGVPGVCLVSLPFVFGGPTGVVARTGFVATGGTPVPITVANRPFSTGFTFVGGTGTAPIFGQGSNQLTPDGAGQMTLVTPIRILIDQSFVPLSPYWIGIAELELHYVPEPGVAALLAWGAAWLAWTGARRWRD